MHGAAVDLGRLRLRGDEARRGDGLRDGEAATRHESPRCPALVRGHRGDDGAVRLRDDEGRARERVRGVVLGELRRTRELLDVDPAPARLGGQEALQLIVTARPHQAGPRLGVERTGIAAPRRVIRAGALDEVVKGSPEPGRPCVGRGLVGGEAPDVRVVPDRPLRRGLGVLRVRAAPTDCRVNRIAVEEDEVKQVLPGVHRLGGIARERPRAVRDGLGRTVMGVRGCPEIHVVAIGDLARVRVRDARDRVGRGLGRVVVIAAAGEPPPAASRRGPHRAHPQPRRAAVKVLVCDDLLVQPEPDLRRAATPVSHDAHRDGARRVGRDRDVL